MSTQTRRTTIRLRENAERPATRETGEERGLALRWWLFDRQIKVGAFAEVSGVPLGTLQRYISGSTDLATASGKNARAIITGMGVSDEEARTELGIPEDKWPEWTTTRPTLGSAGAPKPSGRVPLTLADPTSGDAIVPARSRIEYAPGEIRWDYHLCLLADGRYHVVDRRRIETAPPGEWLGGLVSSQFSARPV